MRSTDEFVTINNEVSPKMRTFLQFLSLLEELSVDLQSYKQLIDPAAQFREFPNLLNKNGQLRNWEESVNGLKTARQILAEQSYNVVAFAETTEKLIVEMMWSGTMSVDLGQLNKGQQLKAYICAIVEFKDGKIYKQRNYDCYEPF